MVLEMDEVQEHITMGSANSASGGFSAFTGKSAPEKRGLRRRLWDLDRFPQFAAKPGLKRLESGYRKLVSGYVRRTPLLLKDLEFQLFEANNSPPADWEENPLEAYAVTAHGIKFASEGILALTTSKKAEDMEKAALRGDLSFLKEKTPEFLSYMDYFLKSLKHLLDGGLRSY